MPPIEIIRENLSPQQVMTLRADEKAKGNTVNVRRIHSALVEIEIIPSGIIDITIIQSSHSNKGKLRRRSLDVNL